MLEHIKEEVCRLNLELPATQFSSVDQRKCQCARSRDGVCSHQTLGSQV